MALKFARLTVAEYDEFCQPAKRRNYFQCIPMFNRYKNGVGYESYMLGVKRKKELLAAALVVKTGVKKLPIVGEQKIYTIYGGPLMNYKMPEARPVLEKFLQGTAKFLRERGGAILEVEPNLPRGEVSALEEWLREAGLSKVECCEKYIIELEGKTEAEVLQGLRRSVRSNMKWAQRKYGVRVREISPQKVRKDLTVLKDVLDETDEVRELREAFGRKMKYFVAEMRIPEDDVKSSHAGEVMPMAVGMFAMVGSDVVYVAGTQRRVYQRYAGLPMVFLQILQYVCTHKQKRVDLTAAEPRVRQGLSGEMVEYVGKYALPLSWYGKRVVKKRAKNLAK